MVLSSTIVVIILAVVTIPLMIFICAKIYYAVKRDHIRRLISMPDSEPEGQTDKKEEGNALLEGTSQKPNQREETR